MLAENPLALFADIHAFPAVGDIVGRGRRGAGVGRECVGDQRVGRGDDAHPLLLRLAQDFEGHRKHLGLADRVADAPAQGCFKGVGHAAAQDDRIDLFHELFDDRDFGRDLRSAQHGAERTARVLQDGVDGPQFVLHHVPEHLVVGEIVGDQRRRSVGAVGSAESVVDVAVGIGGQPLDKLLLRSFHRALGLGLLLVGCVVRHSAGFALLFGVETQVFEQHHLARLQFAGHLGRLVTHRVAGEKHLAAEPRFDGGDDLRKREFRVVILLGASQVRHQDYRAAALEHLFDGWDSRPDAGVVCHTSLRVEGHVEIDTDDGALAFEIIGINFVHSRCFYV